MEKGTEDTSNLVQIEEVKCAIEKLPFVTVLSPVRAVKGKGRGYGVTLRCPSCEEYRSSLSGRKSSSLCCRFKV
jgi:hypothetical protein